ncbi:hypothetical protein ALC53_00891 [Atta colombica]|uniref:Uncharacterized protein n=1 Tax=Atta colombica TaxID=520822 RepID=A0A195BWV0_9HYME|nr:hypothetical protein ALC53_00891 [Atta colombica]
MCNATVYVPYLRCVAIVIEPLRQCVSPLPSVRLPPQRVLTPRSQSLVPVSISCLSLYLSPSFDASDDNRILSERALARTISRPICSFLQQEPLPSYTQHVHREDFGLGDPLLPVCSLVGYVHARSHAHDSRPGGRFQSGGVDEDDEENGGGGDHDDGPC